MPPIRMAFVASWSIGAWSQDGSGDASFEQKIGGEINEDEKPRWFGRFYKGFYYPVI